MSNDGETWSKDLMLKDDVGDEIMVWEKDGKGLAFEFEVPPSKIRDWHLIDLEKTQGEALRDFLCGIYGLPTQSR